MQYTNTSFRLLISVVLMLFSVSAHSADNRYKFTFQPDLKDQIQKYDETKQLRIAQQYGVAYLPLMIMRQNQLIEKHARAAGLGSIRVSWLRFPSGEKMNEALRTGFLDIATGGVVPMLRAWDKTRDSVQVKGIAALGSIPMYLNTSSPGVKTLSDFTEKDRIALPAVKQSSQAIVLQMAAARVFGGDQYSKLDELTVSMSHPEATQALLKGQQGITAHITSPPFQYQEIEHPGIHKVLDSYDVLGGAATFSVLWASESFRSSNPRTVKVVFAALREAMEIIRIDYRSAARSYMQHAGSDLSEEFIYEVITRPEVNYTTVPLNIMQYAEFMHTTGMIDRRPADWREVFFDEAGGLPGS